MRKAEAGPPPAAGAADDAHQGDLHPLLGRLHGDRRSVERRVDRPGAGLGQPDQPRLALRQGRLGARTGAWRPPAEISDEAGQRPVDADFLGYGDQRDRRQARRDPREVGAGLGLLARLGEILQRGRLPQSQVRRLLGDQQFRSPGPHLSFDHRRRRRQYLGLRRDDQQLQRHPQFQDARDHGRQSGGSPSGVAAAPAGRQGAQPREFHRHRSAPDAHRGARDRIRARAQRHAHSDHLRHALAHLQERLGGQGVHQAARLRDGRRPQGSRQVESGGGRARDRRSGRAAQARRPDVRHAEARDPDLGDGPDPVLGRHRERPRELHPLSRDRQRRQVRHRRQHLPRPLQRAGRDRPRPRYRDAAALLRPRRRRVEALVAASGKPNTSGSSPASIRRPAPTASRSR